MPKIKTSIVYIGPFRFPNYDAASARVLNNAKLFRSIGFDVSFISWGGRERQEDKNGCNYFYEGFQYTVTHEIDVGCFLQKISNIIHFRSKSLELLRQISVDKVVIVGYNLPFLFLFKLKRVINKRKWTLILDETEWSQPNEFRLGVFSPQFWLNEFNILFYKKKVSLKIVISSFLNKHYRRSSNVIIPPLVDKNDFRWNLSSERIDTNYLRLVYAGSPGKKDLVKNMIQAVLLLLQAGKKIHFRILGVSEAFLNDDSKLLSSVRKYPDYIRLMGRVSQEEVSRYFYQSHFSLILRPSTKKSQAGFPTKLVESLMASCPVITNNTSDIEKYIKDGYNGFIIKDSSTQSLVNLLSEVLCYDNNHLKQMKLSAKASAILNFDYRQYVTSLDDFFRMLNKSETL